MPLWGWFAIAIGTGALVGLEVWAWLRHGTSAIVLAVTGAVMLAQGAVIALIVGGFALGIVAGFTGWDPVGLNQGSSDGGAAVEGQGCDPSYADDCLDPDALDYDCEDGRGDGPLYVTGPVTVTGSDPYGLDRDGNGVGCES